MKDIVIGKGNMSGKGVFAARDFRKGEVVIRYDLRPLTGDGVNRLSEDEKQFTHVHWGTVFLYAGPERYVNHAASPNTVQDLVNRCDIAARDIKKGEEITTNSAKDDIA